VGARTGRDIGSEANFKRSESKLEELKADVNQVKADVDEVKADVKDIKRKLTVLTQDMMQHRADQLGLERRMDALDSRPQ